MTNEHWRFFLALEQDVERTTRFVEPAQANYRTYSIEFARLIISTCSEADVVAKVLCTQIAPSARAENIDQYRATILNQFPQFHAAVVRVPRFGLAMRPWDEWGRGENPGWWRDHQLVKHRRHENFAKADLEHCIVSAAGLMCLVLYLCRDERIGIERSAFFDMSLTPVLSGTYSLPDDPC